MKNINKILERVRLTPEDEKEAPSEDFKNQTAELVNEVFKRMMSLLPAYKQAWPTQAIFDGAKREWLKSFLANNINSIDKLEFGMNRLRQSENPFPPAVGKFIKWCSPSAEDLGLPSVYKAFQEACKNAANSKYERVEWTHPAVHHTAVETGYYKLTNKREDESFKLFDRNYEITIKMLLNGEELKEIPKALPKQVDVPDTPGVGTSHLKDLLNKLK